MSRKCSHGMGGKYDMWFELKLVDERVLCYWRTFMYYHS